VSGIGELFRYDGRRVVVTGCASGIGAHVARQVAELGGEVIGLDLRPPAGGAGEFIELDLSDPESIDRAALAVGDRVDALFNVAGVSSGIRDPLRVVTVNFLGPRRFTETLIPKMPAGSAIANVSSLAARAYRENASVTAGLVETTTMDEGIDWCRRHPDALEAGGGYRLSKEAIILYGMAHVASLGAKGIRINCTAPGVTDTPILDQLRSAYGQEYLDSFRTPLGRAAEPAEQAAVLTFLNSAAASYLTGQVIWVDGGTIGETDLADQVKRR